MAVYKSCAFFPCEEVKTCALVGGCVKKRFGHSGASAVSKEALGRRKLAGTKPRPSRDPALTRHRK